MKIRKLERQSHRGLMLIECLTYIAVLAVIFAVGYGTYFRAFDSSRALQRNARDITRALNAGELWRGDIRKANSISFTNNVLQITQPAGRVEYAFENGSVWRTFGTKPRARFLSDVKDSAMACDQQNGVPAWRWELELKTRKANTKLKPLFSFQAVPQSFHPAAIASRTQ